MAPNSVASTEVTMATSGGSVIRRKRGGSVIALSNGGAPRAGSADNGGRSQSGTRLKAPTSAELRTAKEAQTGASDSDYASASIADAAMERYATGDEAAFADVYDAVAPRLYGYLHRQTRDAARAEDIVQSTLLHMHRGRGTFITGGHVLPWAFAIARRLLIDDLRRARRDATARAAPVEDEMMATSADSATASLEAGELAHAVESELSRLPKSQQEAFELVRLDGLSHAEAAEALGVTVSSVKLRVHRAYCALKRVVAGC